MSTKAKKAVGQTIRSWRLKRWSGVDLSTIAGEINPRVRGWINYYGGLLPLRVVLPRTAHRSTPNSMGHAQVQATQGQNLRGGSLARLLFSSAHLVSVAVTKSPLVAK